LGDPQRTVAHWVIQFKARGLHGLRDAEKCGRPGKLSPARKKALSNSLAKSPKEAGLNADAWTGTILASFLRKRFGVTLTPRHCFRLLRSFKNQPKA
jgi:transposase